MARGEDGDATTRSGHGRAEARAQTVSVDEVGLVRAEDLDEPAHRAYRTLLLDMMERFARILNKEATPVEFAGEKEVPNVLQNLDKTWDTWQA